METHIIVWKYIFLYGITYNKMFLYKNEYVEVVLHGEKQVPADNLKNVGGMRVKNPSTLNVAFGKSGQSHKTFNLIFMGSNPIRNTKHLR